MKKKATLFLSALFVIIFAAVILYAFLGDLFTPRSELDVADRQNDKIIHMLNTQIEKQIEDHAQSTMYPGIFLQADKIPSII